MVCAEECLSHRHRAKDRRVREPQGIQGVAKAGVRVKPEAELGEAGSTCSLMPCFFYSTTEQMKTEALTGRAGLTVYESWLFKSPPQGDRAHSRPALDGLRLQELWHVVELECPSVR